MASLSNINGLFDVHSTGAILFSTSHGANGQILKSNGNAAPTWVDPNTVGTGPWLPLAGGGVTGNLTVGGTLGVTGDATFSDDVFTVGKLGVGTSDPGAEGYSYAEDLVILGGNSASDGAGITIRNNGKRYSVIAFGNGAGATGEDNDGEIFYDQTDKTMNFRTNHSPTVTFTNVGKVVAAAATVSADSANTLTTKGYVDGLPQGDLTAITVGNGLAGTSLSGPIPDLTMSGSYTGTFTSTAVETASITLPSTTLTIGTRLEANTVVVRGFYANGGGKLSFVSGYASVSTYNWTTGEVFATDDGNFNGRLEFRTGDTSRLGPTTKMTIRHTGAVAFGTSITNYGTSGQVLTSAGNTTPTWTTPTTGTITGAGSLNFLPKYLSNGTNIGNSILKDLNGQLNTSTAQSVIGVFQGTTPAGYAEFHLKNDAGNLLVMGSIGSGYTSVDYTNATYLYNSGSGRNFWVKSQNDIGFFSGGTTIASHKRMTILSAGNIQMTNKLVIGATTPQNYRLQLGLNGSLVDSIAMGNYAVAKNTRQYIGYTRADTGLFESAGNGDTISTVMAGVTGVRIVNTEGTLASSQADNSVQLLTHIYNGGSRVALHARYDGNIGIGTEAPGYKLQVQGTGYYSGNLTIDGFANGSGISFRGGFAPDANVGITAKAVGTSNRDGLELIGYNGIDFTVDSGTNTVMRIVGVTGSGVGNVGIGTLSPDAKLDIHYPDASTYIALKTKLDATYSMGISNEWVSTYVSKLKLGRVGISSISNMEFIYDIAGAEYGSIKRNYTASSLKFERGTIVDMIISGSGNVGIKETSPSSKLQVGGRLDAETITIGGFYASGGGSLKFISGYTSVPSYTWTTGQILATDDGNFNGRIEFKTGDTGRLGPTTKMTVKNNGDVLIGSTSNSGASFGSPTLKVAGNRATLGLISSGSLATIALSASGVSGRDYHINHDGTNGNLLFYSYVYGGTAFTMAGNGTFTAGGDIVAYSDKRLKSNIKTLDGSKVLKMRGVSFDKDGKKGSGVIAQELEKIAPELVYNESEYKGVAYGNLVGYLIEAIKELEARVKILENK